MSVNEAWRNGKANQGVVTFPHLFATITKTHKASVALIISFKIVWLVSLTKYIVKKPADEHNINNRKIQGDLLIPIYDSARVK